MALKSLNDRNMNLIDRIILFCLENKLIVTLLLLIFLIWGIMTAAPMAASIVMRWAAGTRPRSASPGTTRRPSFLSRWRE